MKFDEVIISETLSIREIEINELAQAYPIIHQLRTHLSLDEYIADAKAMIASGYQAVCLFENGSIAAYAGFSVLLNLYYGHHIWVYDLVTESEKRSKGYGKVLLTYIEQWAKDNALGCVALSSGLQREDAHRFYEKNMNYHKVSYVFKKQLL